MLGHFPRDDANICEISQPVFRKLYKLLDLDDKWMKIIEVIPPKHVTYTDIEIHTFGNEIYGPMKSPARAMLRSMGSRGLRVRHLIGYLDRLKLERELELICPPVPIKVQIHPKASQSLAEGDRLELVCQATGFPYPMYQWFKGKEPVVDGDKEVLVISNIRHTDAGVYCCRAHNKLKLKDDIKFSTKCRVAVEPNDSSAPVHYRVNLSGKVVLRQHQQGLKYQWQKDGNVIPGAVEPTLKIPKATLADTGNYKCLIDHTNGRQTATDIVLDVVLDACAAVESQEIEPEFPVISRQPRSCAVEPGGDALFRVEASGPHLRYQWYKGPEACEVMPGECRKELLVSPQSLQDSCQYTCIVLNEFGQAKSMPASLLVKEQIGCRFTAIDKLALLIGNGEYRLHRPLPGTRSDIRDLAQKLNQMGFKVITLVNLTKDEMLNSIDAFCSLLAKDVYCLFYFAGHGFKNKDQGRHYLAPVEANVTLSVEECVCAEVIRQRMQDRNPSLNVMFLDICRVMNKDSKAEPDVDLKPTAPNTFIGYATSEGNKAYDDKVSQEGLFAKHLKKVLMQPKDLREMFADLQAEVRNDLLATKHKQIPEASTTMLERRSLMDEIRYTGYTQEYNKRTQVWENDYGEIPPTRKLTIADLGIIIHLEFEKEFSNVLNVTMRVGDWSDRVVSCMPIICKDQLPKTLSIRQDASLEYGTWACISDLQKLREPLELLILIDINMADGNSSMGQLTLDLGLPLVSKLELYMEHKDAVDFYGGACGSSPMYNKPVEQDWTCTSSAELDN